MPSVASARRAAKFCAKPTAAMTSASSCAVLTPSRWTFAFAVGWTAVAPPTRPTAMGSSIVPPRSPLASFSHAVAAVDDEVGDDHVAPFRVHDADLDVLRSAAELHEHRILLVRNREDLVLVVEDRHPSAVGIRDPDELDLANHDGTGRARREAAPSPGR